ncbi:Hypothetical Protein FCC1311_009422 [Hondaea fermentalgiana]|uniref:Uncharacterized protein n=1 Tax=Hondaea fermentalgiana TaxID=2315210 RepID=A0A2R5GAK9_9STRA|nr:Hypothetical Protein FCC1311_009422 [Hondaea fermentalgiana]|eukprot:GBG24724.1 Hypothetical Protein FCC1311_009422 [Hondaea fermentalgiana]
MNNAHSCTGDLDCTAALCRSFFLAANLFPAFSNLVEVKPSLEVTKIFTVLVRWSQNASVLTGMVYGVNEPPATSSALRGTVSVQLGILPFGTRRGLIFYFRVDTIRIDALMAVIQSVLCIIVVHAAVIEVVVKVIVVVELALLAMSLALRVPAARGVTVDLVHHSGVYLAAHDVRGSREPRSLALHLAPAAGTGGLAQPQVDLRAHLLVARQELVAREALPTYQSTTIPARSSFVCGRVRKEQKEKEKKKEEKMSAMATEHEQDEDLAELLAALEPLPLQFLDQMLGGMLFPNGVVGDLQQWRGNTGLAESLRNMYLRKAFGRGEAYERGLQRAADPGFLPSRQDLIELFGLQRPAPENWQRAGPKDHLKRKQDLMRQALAAQPPGSVQGWSLEDKLEALGCAVWGRGAFNLVAEETGRYEFYTREYIESLARYVHERLEALGAARGGASGDLVEVGAGSGSLTFFLNAALEKLGSKHRCLATDPDLRPAPRQRAGPSGESGSYTIDPLNVSQALSKYSPVIVLCAWMPMDTDWSSEFRKCSSVQEYVLVGEADFGACGHNWLTWGNAEFREEGKHESTAPFLAEGWSRVDLPDISRWQMQRYDSDHYAGNSITVSFRRSP